MLAGLNVLCACRSTTWCIMQTHHTESKLLLCHVSEYDRAIKAYQIKCNC